MPHASTTPLLPGARHGLCLYTSRSEPAFAARLTVRCSGLLIVAFIPLPHRSICLRPFTLSHVGQPIEHPCWYQ